MSKHTTSNPPKLSWATYTTSNTNRMDSTSVNSNQINGYDAAGNITNDGLYQYLYDGEGRVCAAKNTLAGTMTQYIYDSAGNRVGKGMYVPVTLSCDFVRCAPAKMASVAIAVIWNL